MFPQIVTAFSLFFVLQLKTFSSREIMMQSTAKDAEGTLSYVTATGSLFLKVSQGWKEIQVPTQMNLPCSTSHILVVKICNDVSTPRHREMLHLQLKFNCFSVYHLDPFHAQRGTEWVSCDLPLTASLNLTLIYKLSFAVHPVLSMSIHSRLSCVSSTQLGSLIYLSNNIIPQDEVLISYFLCSLKW